MDKPRHSTSGLCRTLAHALKRLFKSVKVQDIKNSHNAPIDIIRKDLNRMSYLRPISTVSLFPDFEQCQAEFDPAEYPVSARALPPHPSNTTLVLKRFLLPAKSLSHFNLRQAYSDQSDLPTVPGQKMDATRSCQLVENVSVGRVVSQQPVLIPQRSRSHTRSLQPTISSASLAASFVSDRNPPAMRRTKPSGDLRKCASTQSSAIDPALTSIPEHSPSSAPKESPDDSLRLVRHFASFCIIDVSAPGCPVSAVSEDLRYIYDIKDRFVLNAQECSELSMDLSVGRDPDGNEVTYVLLFGPLVSPTTAKGRFVLVSAIDVSGYVRFAASLDCIPQSRDESVPPRSYRKKSGSARQSCSSTRINECSQQLADDFHDARSIKETRKIPSTTSLQSPQTSDPRRSKLDSEDIWTAIAREEGLICRKSSAGSISRTTVDSPSNAEPSRKQTQSTSSNRSKSSLGCADEEVLETFIEGLQVLYSEYFLLSCMPFYEIYYVSPAVYESGDYDVGHLSHTTSNLMNDLGTYLAAGRRFRTTIRWGQKDVKRRLYCVPLMGPEPAPWICFLVDMETPIHW